MALLGVELVITIVAISLIHRFSIYFSFARWLISFRLIRYTYPTVAKIKQSSNFIENGISKTPEKWHKINRTEKDRPKSVKGRRKNDKQPKQLEDRSNIEAKEKMTIEAERIHPIDLINLHFYKEFQWLLDFAICAFFVYLLSELHYFFVPSSKEMNLSLIWCCLVIFFSIKILSSLTSIYFKGNDEAIGERSMCLVSGCLYFLLAMIVLIGDESFVEFGLGQAYSVLNSSAATIVETYSLHSVKSVLSHLMFKFWLSVWSGVMGAFFIFPGFRLAQMYIDSVSYSKGKPFRQFLLHAAFISPLLVGLLWIRPVGRAYFTEREWKNRGPLMSANTFELLRIYTTLIIMVIRLLVMPWYIQAYLNLAPRRLSEIHKESKKMKNEEIRRSVNGIFFYLCVVCLHYICPLVMCFFLALLHKNLGGYSWLSLIKALPSAPESSSEGAIFFRGTLGFMSWWLIVIWFSSSIVGFGYQSYLAKDSATIAKR